MKSEQAHKAALQLAIQSPLRVCCARETMASIAHSSHKVLSDAIYAHNMATSQNGPFEVQRDRILRRDGDRIVSEFLFIGIREDVRATKSLKGINLTIVEEGAKVSEDSWQVLIPTVMRTDTSRVWVIWNPESVTDPTYKRFVLEPPTGTIHILTSYLDNPWLPNNTLIEAEDCKRTNYELYEHIWLGKPISAITGAIFGEEMKAAEKELRVNTVPYNRAKPVHTSWDIGADGTVIWFVQAYDGQLWFIDYFADHDRPISDYLIELNNKRYVWGRHHLPHDAVDSQLHRKNIMGGNQDKSATVQTIMRDAGFNATVGPKLGKIDRLNFVRTRFPVCHFDAVKCASGIQKLKEYQWDRDLDDTGKRKPLHNEASHTADSFMEACVSVKERIDRPLPVAHTGAAVADL